MVARCSPSSNEHQSRLESNRHWTDRLREENQLSVSLYKRLESLWVPTIKANIESAAKADQLEMFSQICFGVCCIRKQNETIMFYAADDKCSRKSALVSTVSESRMRWACFYATD